MPGRLLGSKVTPSDLIYTAMKMDRVAVTGWYSLATNFTHAHELSSKPLTCDSVTLRAQEEWEKVERTTQNPPETGSSAKSLLTVLHLH